MGAIGRYIFRTTLGAFLVVLVSLTAIIWVTQALRDIDLMTNQGQTILVFVGITGLIVPLLILVIAPLALVIAVAHTLNKLSTDSEIIVMNAAGIDGARSRDQSGAQNSHGVVERIQRDAEAPGHVIARAGRGKIPAAS